MYDGNRWCSVNARKSEGKPSNGRFMSTRTYFSLYLIIKELLLEGNEGVVCAVVVQIQWVQHIPKSDTETLVKAEHCLTELKSYFLPKPPLLHRDAGWSILLHHWGFLCLQDVVSKDPRHWHLDGELDPAPHCEFQEKLPEPQLGQVAAMLQGLCTCSLII